MSQIRDLALEYIEKIDEKCSDKSALTIIKQAINNPEVSDEDIINAFSQTIKQKLKQDTLRDPNFANLCQEFINKAFTFTGVILPNELLVHTLQFLDAYNLKTAKLVSKHWHKLINTTPVLNKDCLLSPLYHFKNEYQSILHNLNTELAIKIAMISPKKLSGQTSFAKLLTTGLLLENQNSKPTKNNVKISNVDFLIEDCSNRCDTVLDESFATKANAFQAMASIVIYSQDITQPNCCSASDALFCLDRAIECNKPIMFVFTKFDLYSGNENCIENMKNDFLNEFRKYINESNRPSAHIVGFFECSAKTGKGIEKIWKEILDHTAIPKLKFIKKEQEQTKEIQQSIAKNSEETRCRII